MKFTQVVKDIKTLRIQGAEGVAREGVRSLLLVLKESHAVTHEAVLAELYHARDQLIAARPTEPCLRNALAYVFHNIYSYDEHHSLFQMLTQRINEVILFFDTSKQKIAQLGAAKIRHKSIVYTHCHSSTVVAILLAAKKQGKKFTVHNTETRPLFQGRKTATELVAAGIPVKYFVDSAAGIAMKEAHLALFGSDAITSYAVYNKIGSGIFAELLTARKIPLYICSDAWKFDSHASKRHKEVVEMRPPYEIWQDAPRGVVVEDPAFEAIILPDVKAFITELGVQSPSVFLKDVKKKYNWMQ
ncbi:translation initiation factor eIF-2B [Candidatus Woesearchaeota archaeon]|nr:translation initiation factor eIF-2B [Candidatus Woesearchaeota archaeon]